VPHPIPYQGSKRRLAPVILQYFPTVVRTLIEPFAGSAAVSLAALHAGHVPAVHLGDSFEPLIALWTDIMERPGTLHSKYTSLWTEQLSDPRAFYTEVRAEFNARGGTHRLLYLLARCVKSAVRFNRAGQFNQSADHRRLGTRPKTMKTRIEKAHRVLQGRTALFTGDYRELVCQAQKGDIVYLDPPYEGTSGTRDTRYFEQFNRVEFVECLEQLLRRKVPFIVSLDGRTEQKDFGTCLPEFLGLTRLEVDAGPSSQATLHGRRAHTIESLYLSPDLGASIRQ